MEILSTTTALPEGSVAFVFGSFLKETSPSDLDMLILYDPATCDPKEAYHAHETFLDAVRRLVPVPVDITLLSHVEAHGCRFLEQMRCVPFTDVEDTLTMRWRTICKSAAALSLVSHGQCWRHENDEARR